MQSADQLNFQRKGTDVQILAIHPPRGAEVARSRPKVPDGWIDDGARAIARRQERETDAMLVQFGAAAAKVYNLAAYRVARILVQVQEYQFWASHR
jgi:hypothetical protein